MSWDLFYIMLLPRLKSLLRRMVLSLLLEIVGNSWMEPDGFVPVPKNVRDEDADVVCDSGLGELICLKFAAEGCDVAVNYNASKERAEGVKGKIETGGASGTRVFVVQGVSLSFVLLSLVVSG